MHKRHVGIEMVSRRNFISQQGISISTYSFKHTYGSSRKFAVIKKCTVNVQVGGGPAATTFRKDKFYNFTVVYFTELPDTCMCTSLKRASNDKLYTKYRLKKNVFTMITFSHVVNHVFRGCMVVDKNTKQCTFFMTDNL